MGKSTTSNGGENFDLRDILSQGRELGFEERIGFFSGWINGLFDRGESLHLRIIDSPVDREVTVLDRYTGERRKMLMFGSNSYLGLTNHPYVQEQVKRAVDEYGAGVAGPPLLNGYTSLHRELEERLSAFKEAEDTVLFHSGYGTNIGLVSSLFGEHDTVLFDEYSHASFYDGLKMNNTAAAKFPHNDIDELERLLEAADSSKGDVFVCVEGAYSMDGDLAPLDQIAVLCEAYDAFLIVDDAHGTGVTGPAGKGTAKHFGVNDQVDINWGTFSKSFGVVGGFVSTSKPVADYLRFFARSYMFSASLPPAVCATVLAGLDLLEREPEIHERLWRNIRYATRGLRQLGFDLPEPQTAIIPLHVPGTMNVREAAFDFHEAGLFLNTIEYPAVPVDKQRFRVSIMASHTKKDIDRLLECVEQVWEKNALPIKVPTESPAPRVEQE